MSDDNAERMLVEAELRQHIRDMSDNDFRALVAETRPPDTAGQLREVASQFLQGDQLRSFVEVADPAKFVDAGGHIDASSVARHLGALFGTSEQRNDWGQHSGGAPGSRPGDGGRAEASRRFGTPHTPDPAAVAATPRPGAAGAAEAEHRFGPKD